MMGENLDISVILHRSKMNEEGESQRAIEKITSIIGHNSAIITVKTMSGK